LYRHDLPKCSRPVQMFAAANISTFFLGIFADLWGPVAQLLEL
jgi:hypothetical protein